MSFHFVFLLSSYLLVFLGLLGLLLTGQLSYPYLLLAGVSFITGVWGEVRGNKEFLPVPLANIAMLGVFIFTLFSIFVLKTLPIEALVHFLLALQAVKLLAPKKNRDWSQIYLLSFFSLVAASALSVEIFFAVIFICYLFTGPWVLVLFHLKRAMEAAGKNPDQETRLPSWSLFRLVGGVSILLLFFTLLFFTTFPRFGVGFLGSSWAGGSAMTGFSDRLALGEVAEIQKNAAVAMRVSLDRPETLRGRELHWRGVVLDLFDGRKWQKSKTNLTRLRRRGETYLVGEKVSNSTPLIRQRIILEPTGSAALFTMNKPVMISGRLHNLFRDPLGNIRAASSFPIPISYETLSYLEANWQERPPSNNFLQLPPVVDSRIAALSRRITEGINTEINKARTLEKYLKENYRYTLKGLPVGGKDPLATFLFGVRQGNCEYFSSALTVMLRSLGIPARVVNGYLGGEWNPYGGYYLIRQSDAHSWVEAYISDRGWVTFDPTTSRPAGARRPFFSSFSQLVDFLRMRWYRHVVNFSFGDQYRLFTTLKRPRRWFDFGGLSASELRNRLFINPSWWIGTVLLLVILAIGWIWLRGKKIGRKAYSQGLSHQATERYRRFLALLGKKGFRKKPGETPDEFSQRTKIEGNGLVKEFTALYQQTRFSERMDSTEGLKKLDQLLIHLGK